MNKLWICIYKEWLLLYRDKLALVVLFVMPMFFVLVISLIQAHNPKDVSKIPILVYSNDNGNLTSQFFNELTKSKQFQVINANKQFSNIEKAKMDVAKGRYQALIIFPKNMSKAFSQYTKESFVFSHDNKINLPEIKVYLDPAINVAIKNVVRQSITLAIQNFQIQAAAEIISGILGTPTTHPKTPNNLIQIHYASIGKTHIKPNPVQQNVPAWAIFGMFFIVIPLSGILIKERSLNISQRLLIAPISRIHLLFARVIAFVIVNLLQLFAMLLVGIIVLPWFGLPALQLTHLIELVITGIITASAATSFGLFIGAFARTYEQASAIGPLLVVLAAALGGIMLPTYLMPESLQSWSVISPMNWAQHAFIDIFVRNANIITILPQLIKLLIFSGILLALVYMRTYVKPIR